MQPRRKPHNDASHEVQETSAALDHAAEKRLVRKLDLHIIPLVMSLYLCECLEPIGSVVYILTCEYTHSQLP
jgi:hypothetical protein